MEQGRVCAHLLGIERLPSGLVALAEQGPVRLAAHDRPKPGDDGVLDEFSVLASDAAGLRLVIAEEAKTGIAVEAGVMEASAAASARASRTAPASPQKAGR